MGAKLVEGAIGQVAAFAQITRRTPVEPRPGEAKGAGGRGQPVEHLHRRGDNLRADAIATDRSDPVLVGR